ncbi:MAG: hypothetical protein J0I20_11765 [Chloroflexi bacterium]|nr:hypothetical protein [Chloroflexota bacterium]OJV92410.1 MAG: hypothetical protein BGO39_31285 [Chloroflexi bacterium 54-19]
MEIIEQVIDLPKLGATVVAHNADSMSLINILLSEEEFVDEAPDYGWYLTLKHFDPAKKVAPAWVELDPEEVQFLQHTLKKALYKLIILEKVKIEGTYTLVYEGIKNLRLELKSQENNPRLEFTLLSPAQKKYVTRLVADDIRAILLKLPTVKTTGEAMVKQLKTIEALTENLVKQSTVKQTTIALPAAPMATIFTAAQPIDGEHLVKHLERMASKTKKVL